MILGVCGLEKLHRRLYSQFKVAKEFTVDIKHLLFFKRLTNYSFICPTVWKPCGRSGFCQCFLSIRHWAVIWCVRRPTWTATSRRILGLSTAWPVSTRAQRTWPLPAPQRSAPSGNKWWKKLRWVLMNIKWIWWIKE